MGSCAQCLSNPFALSPFSFSHIFLMTPLHLWTRVVLWRAHPGRDVWGEAGLHALVGLLRRLGHSPLTPLSAWASMVCVHCLLPSLHGLCVRVWGLNLQPLSNPVVLSVHIFALLLCERRPSKNLTIWRGLEDWFENHCSNIFGVYFLLFLQLTCFLY